MVVSVFCGHRQTRVGIHAEMVYAVGRHAEMVYAVGRAKAMGRSCVRTARLRAMFSDLGTEKYAVTLCAKVLAQERSSVHRQRPLPVSAGRTRGSGLGRLLA